MEIKANENHFREHTSENRSVENSTSREVKVKIENHKNIKMENLPVESTEKEKEFLDMIFALESEKQSLIEESRTRLSQMRKDVEVNFVFHIEFLNLEHPIRKIVFRIPTRKMRN